MQRFSLKTGQIVAVVLAALLAAGPALAEKPSRDEYKGRSQKHQQVEKRERGNAHERERGNSRTRAREEHRVESRHHFSEQQRTYLRDHYAERFRSGHCPPGLARKHNGCMPPGQARKWRIGHPLPRDVVFYNLAPTVAAHLGPPPSGYRYVRVASDILLIAVGTGLVVDAIQDLGRR